nr:MAG TPA: hypothetical protein [Caudoviricetes sp.]
MLKVNCQNWSRRKAKIIIQVQKVLRHIKSKCKTHKPPCKQAVRH